MELPDLPDAADAAGDLANWGWKNWDLAAKRLAKLREWFRGEHGAAADGNSDEAVDAAPVRPILLLGPGGTGKTTFGRLISGDAVSPFEETVEYRESLIVETYQFADDADATVIVPPGQSHRRAATWESLLDRLAGGEFRGVILFGSYGFHTLNQVGGYRAHPLFDGGKARFLDDVLAANRGEEVAVAAQVAMKLRIVREPVWLLTCVTKQDLWWPDRAAAEAFYTSGPFSVALDEGLAGCDPAVLRRERAFCCLRILNFRDQTRAILASNAAGYDDPARSESIGRLVENLNDLRVWEQQR